MIYFVCSLNKETEVESESSKTDLKPIKRPTRTKAAKVSSNIFVVWKDSRIFKAFCHTFSRLQNTPIPKCFSTFHYC